MQYEGIWFLLKDVMDQWNDALVLNHPGFLYRLVLVCPVMDNLAARHDNPLSDIFSIFAFQDVHETVIITAHHGCFAHDFTAYGIIYVYKTAVL